MEIPYVAIRRYIGDAQMDYKEYIRRNSEKVKRVRNIPPYKVELKDGTEIYFISENTYPMWCKGRTYKMLGDDTDRLYHNGYEIDSEKEHERARKFSKELRDFDYFLELPKGSGT